MEAEVFLSDGLHPIFKAHFPNNPILPGFIHLEIISDIFDINITDVKKAKFITLVFPSQTLLYKKKGHNLIVTCDKKAVASFSIV